VCSSSASSSRRVGTDHQVENCLAFHHLRYHVHAGSHFERSRDVGDTQAAPGDRGAIEADARERDIRPLLARQIDHAEDVAHAVLDCRAESA